MFSQSERSLVTNQEYEVFVHERKVLSPDILAKLIETWKVWEAWNLYTHMAQLDTKFSVRDWVFQLVKYTNHYNVMSSLHAGASKTVSVNYSVE